MRGDQEGPGWRLRAGWRRPHGRRPESYEEHGRHQIYAGGKSVDLSDTTHNLVLDADAVAAGKQKDLDDLGIAKNAREEKLRARKIEVNANEKSALAQEDERMAALYRQHVLKEQAPEPVIKIAGLGGKKKPSVQDVVHNKPE